MMNIWIELLPVFLRVYVLNAHIVLLSGKATVSKVSSFQKTFKLQCLYLRSCMKYQQLPHAFKVAEFYAKQPIFRLDKKTRKTGSGRNTFLRFRFGFGEVKHL